MEDVKIPFCPTLHCSPHDPTLSDSTVTTTCPRLTRDEEDCKER